MVKRIVILLVIGIPIMLLTIYYDHWYRVDDTSVKPSTVTPYQRGLLLQTIRFAKQGRLATNKEFRIGSTTKDIITKWGKPDKDSDEIMWNYDKHYITFHLDPLTSEKINNIYTNDPAYSKLTMKAVKAVLGRPVNAGYYDGSQLYLMDYYLSNGYVISFYFKLEQKGKLSTCTGVQVFYHG